MRKAAASLLDVLLVTTLASVVLIILTGGGVVHIGGAVVRARGVENPLWILTALVLLRYALREPPLFGVRAWQVENLTRRGIRWLGALPGAFRRPAVAVLLLSIAVFLIRVALAWEAPGFFSGDDVEIHEMTLGALFHKSWSVWDLRCAFFPMVFVYPAQRIAFALGAQSAEALVLSGRIAVALLSTAAVPLAWVAARRLSPADPRLAALSVLLLAVNKLQMSFGSSELPRPVSTVFVLAAFICVLRPRLRDGALGGLLLGTAIALRFSEVIFLPAALVTLGRRSASSAAALFVTAGVTAAVAIGVADAMFWGQPFHSLMAAIDYTLVQRQSTRGFEPFWEYLRIVPSWSTWVVVALALAGTARTRPDSWWLWLPIAILSVLPHKEGRYLLPVIPFLCRAAARGYLRLVEWLPSAADAKGWRAWGRDLFAPIFVLAVLHDTGGWRLTRSNEGIRLAEYLRQTHRAGVAVQDPWRLGGWPYLSPLDPIVEISPELLADPLRFAAAVQDVRWVAIRAREARTVGDPVLDAAGFERDAWRGEDYVLYTRGR